MTISQPNPSQGAAPLTASVASVTFGGIGKKSTDPLAPVGTATKPSTMSRPYEGASRVTSELMNFFPSLSSTDDAHLPDRNILVARTRDSVRNQGWAASGVSRYLDNAVGANMRLAYQPNLEDYTTPEEEEKFIKSVETEWRKYIHDTLKMSDAERQQSLPEQWNLMFRQFLVDGECLAVDMFKNRGGRYATTFLVVDTDRLSTPSTMQDSKVLRAGVALDKLGAAKGYYIRDSHPNTNWLLRDHTQSQAWKYIKRETAWGRQKVIHFFEKTGAHQKRGISRLVTTIKRMRSIDRFEDAHLQSAIINSLLTAYVESPYDPDAVADAVSPAARPDAAWHNQRADWQDEQDLRMNGQRIPALWQGDKVHIPDMNRPAATFPDFEAACLRNISAALRISYEQLTTDYSNTNYSSARAALQEVWKSLSADRTRFANGVCTPMFTLWLEEALNRGYVTLPKGCPTFYEDPQLYLNLIWIGPGRGTIDPLKEAKANTENLANNTTTIMEIAANAGQDWRDIMAQLRREKNLMKKYGLDDPATGPQSRRPEMTPEELDTDQEGP